MIYEMLAGFPPFFDDNPFGIYEKILAGKIEWPRHIEPNAKDLVGFYSCFTLKSMNTDILNPQIKRLLAADRTKRLGALKNGSEDVKRHRWFRSLVSDWDAVYRRRLRPPVVPAVSHDGDVSCYDEYEEIDWRAAPKVTDRERRMFEDF